MANANRIETRTDLASGPRVFAPSTVQLADVEAALPTGWTIESFTRYLITLDDGRIGYRIVRTGDTYEGEDTP